MAITGAPLGPDDLGEPTDASATSAPFSTGTNVEGIRRAISTRGLWITGGIAVIVMLAILDGLNVIHIDLGLGKVFTHSASLAVASPTPEPTTDTSSTTDGTLARLVSSSPTPIATHTPTPSPSVVPAQVQQLAAAPPAAPVPANPFPQSGGTVPNVDASGPSAHYMPPAAGGLGGGNSAFVPQPTATSPEDSARSSALAPALGGGSSTTLAGADTGGGGVGQPSVTGPPGRAAPAGFSTQQISAAGFGSGHVGGYLESTRLPAISRYEIWPGRKLEMLLDDAIIVDLPGTVCAHMLRPAKDSQTGTVVLFPERTELCGKYNTLVGSGASRIQLAFTQATFPDGSTLALDNMGAADRNGWSGLSADVNNHIGAVIGTTLLTTVTAAVTALADPARASSYGVTIETPGQAAADNILQTGQTIVGQKINLPPTLSLKKSTEITLAVDRAIVLPPYSPIAPLDAQAQK